MNTIKRPRLCCVCGMSHNRGNCAAFDHMGRGYVALRNEMDELRREVAALAAPRRKRSRRHDR